MTNDSLNEQPSISLITLVNTIKQAWELLPDKLGTNVLDYKLMIVDDHVPHGKVYLLSSLNINAWGEVIELRIITVDES